MFFSSPIQKDLVSQIKKDSSVLTRIGALSEVNLNFFVHFCLILEYFKDEKVFCWLFTFCSAWHFQMNLEYFPIDSQVSIVLPKDYGFQIQSVA